MTLALTACGGSSDGVATVNGQDITFDEVQRLQYDPETELTAAEYAELLDVFIAWTAFTQEAKEAFDIEATEEAIQAEITKILFESGAPNEEAFLEAQNISLNGLRLTTTQVLIEEGLQTALAPVATQVSAEEADAIMTEQPAEFTDVCLAHILLATEEEAVAVVALLEAGDDFAELAIARSQDPSSAPAGGDLGCAAASQFVPEFSEASMIEPVGEVFGPLQTDFGFHVMRIVSREAKTAQQVLDDLQQDALFEEIDAWYMDVLGRAEVTVDPKYGVWQSGSTARLVPPEG